MWLLISGNKIKGDQQSFRRDKRGIFYIKLKCCKEEVGNFSVKSVMLWAGIPTSISIGTVRTV